MSPWSRFRMLGRLIPQPPFRDQILSLRSLGSGVHHPGARTAALPPLQGLHRLEQRAQPAAGADRSPRAIGCWCWGWMKMSAELANLAKIGTLRAEPVASAEIAGLVNSGVKASDADAFRNAPGREKAQSTRCPSPLRHSSHGRGSSAAGDSARIQETCSVQRQTGERYPP